MSGRNDPCWCGSGAKWKKCHYPATQAKNLSPGKILIKTAEQVAGIRAAGHLAARILEQTCSMAKVGVTTNALDQYAHAEIIRHGATPAPLGYGNPPFPKSICTSLNDVICHGIPDDRPLQEGDILNIDLTVILNGYYGDCSQMVILGNTTEERLRVVKVSYEALMLATAAVKPNLPLYKIGETIENHARSHGCSVVNQFVGHGVGVFFHEEPQVPHHYNRSSVILKPGMTFTIEPMINAGRREAVIDPIDHWTARTIDGRPSAQWEHTLLVTDDGCEILTPWRIDFNIDY